VNAADEIRNLMFTYCELIDAGDVDALAELFAEHITTNVFVQVDEDADTAAARSYWVLLLGSG
jgi:hypothetical protein